MKRIWIFLFAIIVMASFSCQNAGEENKVATESGQQAPLTGQSGVVDDVSQKNIVQVAVGSPDHTTLVTAVKAAELVDALSNAGPFTVFAPTNEAFGKLPAGTVDDLLKPEKMEALQNILQYHVTIAVFKAEDLKDGQVLGQVNGDNITIVMKDGKPTVNGANILASIPASNGLIHVIDQVLLPPAQ